MASLGTLAAELKLEGAAGMISGLRAAGGAVSNLGQTLLGVRGPLARLDGAMQAVQRAGAGVNAAAAPIRNAGTAISQLSGLAGRAAGALQALGRSRSAMLAAFARPAALGELSTPAVRVPFVERPPRSPGYSATSGLASRPTIAVGPSRQTFAPNSAQSRSGSRDQTRSGADFAAGLRGILTQFQTGLREGSGTRRAGRDASASVPLAGTNSGPGRAGQGDRLARVGGFIGGSGGPSVDYHRRTSAATEKSAQTLQTLVQTWAGSNARLPAAVWA